MKNFSNSVNQTQLQNDIYTQIVWNVALKCSAEYIVDFLLEDVPCSEKKVRLFLSSAMSAALLAYEFSFIGLALAAATVIANLHSRNASQFMQSCFFMFSVCAQFSPLSLLAGCAANAAGVLLKQGLWHYGCGDVRKEKHNRSGLTQTEEFTPQRRAI